jgi:hypothetical protein
MIPLSPTQERERRRVLGLVQRDIAQTEALVAEVEQIEANLRAAELPVPDEVDVAPMRANLLRLRLAEARLLSLEPKR